MMQPQLSSAPPRLFGRGGGGDSCASPLAELSGVMIDMARGVFSGESYNPRRVAFHAIRAGAVFAEVTGQTLTGSSRARCQELTSKLSAYRLFASADRFFTPDTDLPSALRGLEAYDPYRRLWITEGLGWYWADRQRTLRRPLFDEGLPRRALIPLHTGAGLALAQAGLGGADRTGAINRFRDDCARFSLPGYRDATFEALGLVAVNLYPELLAEIEQALGRDEEASLFWHGVGRGIYFSPLGFVPLPVTRRRTFDAALNAPRSPGGPENVAAGFGWATALVNIRHPAVLECCRRDIGIAGALPAFANGVAAALAVWREASPDEPLAQSWMELVEAREASGIFHSAGARNAWGEVFQIRAQPDGSSNANR